METIIVGTDFSLPANNAVNYAVQLAKFFNTKLILVNAVSLPLSGYDSRAPLEMISILQENSLNRLNELKKQIIEKNYDFGIECIAEAGASFEVIKEVAGKYSADLAVMGMSGEGGFLKKHVFGSSAILASRELKIPLFIIPESASYHRIHQICFACDMDKIEETILLHTAKYFATAFDAEIELVTVKKNNNEVLFNKNETYAFVEKRLQNTRHKTVYIQDDNTSQALVYYFKFHKTDLVMVNPKKHGFFESLFNASVSQNLAFSIETPLLIIQG